MKTKIIIFLILFGLSGISCDEWLDVGSATQLNQDELFSTDEGFHAALTGVYIGMTSTDLYGMKLTWHMIDYLAHYYALISGANDTYLHTHQYTHANVSPYITNIWNGMYNLIANCNNILEKLEKYKGNINPVNYQLVKGEALALRAFLHFDLMRLFGYGGLKDRNMSGKLAIPYVTIYSKNITPQRSYAETLELLKKDLRDAISLLYGEEGENCYRITYDDDFFDNGPNGKDYGYFTYYNYQNSPRIDYFVAKAILARVLMWEGKSENYNEVLNIAQEWIDSGDDSAQDNWDWVAKSRVTSATLTSRDKVFTQEHIWTLHFTDLNSIIGVWLDASNPNATYQRVFLLKAYAFNIFEVESGGNVGVGDYRFAYLLTPQGSGMNNYATLKMDQNGGDLNTNYKNRIPLISTPEMYYMMAEIYAEQGLLGDAVDCLNTVRNARGISLDLEKTLNYTEVREEILKEYRKEFVSLGQLFYFYKRWNVQIVEGYANEMSDKEYVLPYPDAEVIEGNRVQW